MERMDRLLMSYVSCLVVALSLTITNTLAFSRCDKFSQASNLTGSALTSGSMARAVAGGVLGRFFSSR